METMKAPLAAFAVALPLTLTALAAEAMFDLRDLFWASVRSTWRLLSEKIENVSPSTSLTNPISWVISSVTQARRKILGSTWTLPYWTCVTISTGTAA